MLSWGDLLEAIFYFFKFPFSHFIPWTAGDDLGLKCERLLVPHACLFYVTLSRGPFTHGGIEIRQPHPVHILRMREWAALDQLIKQRPRCAQMPRGGRRILHLGGDRRKMEV